MKIKSTNKTIAVCGAGIAGVALAYYLSKNNDGWKIILIDKNQPLSFTTSKSGENFRDYWPHKCMEQLSSRSIELMEKLKEGSSEDSFNMIFSGYHFVSHKKEKPIFADDNSDHFRKRNKVEINPEIIQKKYPYLDKEIQKSIFIKKAGNIDVYALGSLMLREAKLQGLEFVSGEILNINKKGPQFQIDLNPEKKINADKIIICAGPFINHIAKMIGVEFPVANTLQRKFIIPDPHHIIPKKMPFTIYADEQFLDWSDEEKDFFNSEEKYRWLAEKFPGGIHIKPEPGSRIKIGWAFQKEKVEPQWTSTNFELFPQVVMKGASRFIPRLKEYENSIPTPLIEYAGYYTRTRENWPLIGPSKIENIYVVGVLAGFGTMTACAAGELCMKYIFEKNLPSYAAYFHPERYNDPDLVQEMNELNSDGQL